LRNYIGGHKVNQEVPPKSLYIFSPDNVNYYCEFPTVDQSLKLNDPVTILPEGLVAKAKMSDKVVGLVYGITREFHRDIPEMITKITVRLYGVENFE
jgi:hypothetical protein